MAMWVVDFLRQVRDGKPPQPHVLRNFVAAAAQGQLPDYQVSAFLMAVYHRGLVPDLTRVLTLAMRDSGHTIDLSHVPGRKVDKHSTGGVGDKISLHLAPWVAACGVPVPMVAGRGLGHTGGTLDKLESIPGLRTNLDLARFRDHVARDGVCLMGQTAELAPADRKFYALRDVTATVESIPLITASILAKKLAEGIDALVLDVKVGSGAFMKTLADARALAESLVRVGRSAGIGVRALLTRMDAPLGRTIGNALELRESIDVLHGKGPHDIVELSLALGAHMLVLAERCPCEASARAKMQEVLASGAAWQKFCTMVAAQGGDVEAVRQPERLPQASVQTPLLSPQSGFVASINGYGLGHAAMALGAGRSCAEESVDFGVGIELHRQVGEWVAAGEPLLTAHHHGALAPALQADMLAAYALHDAPVVPGPLVLEVV